MKSLINATSSVKAAFALAAHLVQNGTGLAGVYKNTGSGSDDDTCTEYVDINRNALSWYDMIIPADVAATIRVTNPKGTWSYEDTVDDRMMHYGDSDTLDMVYSNWAIWPIFYELFYPALGMPAPIVTVPDAYPVTVLEALTVNLEILAAILQASDYYDTIGNDDIVYSCGSITATVGAL